MAEQDVHCVGKYKDKEFRDTFSIRGKKSHRNSKSFMSYKLNIFTYFKVLLNLIILYLDIRTSFNRTCDDKSNLICPHNTEGENCKRCKVGFQKLYSKSRNNKFSLGSMVMPSL